MLLQQFTKVQNKLKLSNFQLPMCLFASVLMAFAAGQPATLVAQTDAPAEKKQDDEKLLTEDDLTDDDLGIDTVASITSLSELQTKWSELDKKMTETMSAFKATSDVVKKDEIRGQYQGMVEQANKIVNRIKEVAVLEIEKDPKNANAVKLVMGSLVNDAEFSLKKDYSQRASEVIKIGDKLIKCGIEEKYFEKAAKLDRLSIPARELFEELQIRLREAKADDLPRVKILTPKGDIVVELFENEAPNTVANFISLVEKDFYDDLKFHRVMEGFMAQAGCPKGDGSGGPGYNIECECDSPDARRHFFGSLSMAKQEAKDSGGSQFFLAFDRTSHLDGQHTVFGRIIEGFDVLDSLTRTFGKNGRPIPGVEADVIKSMEVIRKREHEYMPRKVGDPEPKDTPPADPTSESKEDEKPEEEGSEAKSEPSEGSESKESEEDKSDDGDK